MFDGVVTSCPSVLRICVGVLRDVTVLGGRVPKSYEPFHQDQGLRPAMSVPGVPMPSTWIPRKPARAYVRPGTSSRTGHAHVTVSGRCSWRPTQKLSGPRRAV